MLIPLNNDIKFNHKHQEDNFISIEYVCKGYTNLCFNHIYFMIKTHQEMMGEVIQHLFIKKKKVILEEKKDMTILLKLLKD
jgi:uncharacterized protein YuzB (UPF0349 family)